MIRALLVFIFFLVVFTLAVFFAMKEPGFASFSYGNSEYTIRLVDFVIGLFILIPILYIFFKLISLLFNAPGLIHNKMNKRRQEKALHDTQQGLTNYIQGDWAQSEKLLLRSAENSDSAMINYIWAARAAHKRGNFSERDIHLAAAKKFSPNESSTLDILQAEFSLQQQMPEQALANLNKHSDTIRTNPKIATLFANAYEQLKDWEKLAEIIPQLKNSKYLDQKKFSHIEKQALQGLLKNNQTSAEELGTKFKDSILNDKQLTVDYVSALRQQAKYELAEKVAANSLNENWSSELVRQYGMIKFKDPSSALTQAEKWAEQHTDDANLYLSLGRICKKAQLWGKAKAYFESSLSRKPLAETYAELAALHEQLNEIEDAHRCTKKGLKIATRGI